MCISKAELDQRIKKIRNLKMLRAKVDEAIEMFESEVIDFLQKHPECETTDKKGNPVLQYVGADYKAVYAEQFRETLDKSEVRKLLCEDDFQKVRNVTFYHVLRIR